MHGIKAAFSIRELKPFSPFRCNRHRLHAMTLTDFGTDVLPAAAGPQRLGVASRHFLSDLLVRIDLRAPPLCRAAQRPCFELASLSVLKRVVDRRASPENFHFVWAFHLMIEFAGETRAHSIARLGTQPIALAAATLVVILAGIASIVLWRALAGPGPELERTASARQLQARAAQASEQLVEKAKGLEATQQESIDQLQMVQDQLQTVRRLLATQQADTRRLSERVSTLTDAIEGLRQSHASSQASEPSAPPAARNRSVRIRSQASHGAHRSRTKSHS
jgi:hypothetical protein